jgi:hypothetical protein
MATVGAFVADPSRFHDGGDPDSGAPANVDEPIRIQFERKLVVRDGKLCEAFVLERRIGYRDRVFGQILVPPVYNAFSSDLTSVPTLFTWLVPKTGDHLPAALIHDGLVWNPDEEAQTYISTGGHEISRVEADRIFRDGMGDLGTGLLRRWLVWTAVTLATMWAMDGTATSAWKRWYYRLLVPATLAPTIWLGYIATADVFDRTDTWWFAYELPWMGQRSTMVELVGGAAGAVVIPFVFGWFWGRFRTAGWIGGIGIALLLHVSVALLVVTGIYQMLEWLAGHMNDTIRRAVLAVAMTSAVVVFVFIAW